MTERDGTATAVDRIERVCDELEELLAEISAKAQLLRGEVEPDG